MIALLNRTKQLYRRIVNSIAFYPSLITFLFAVTAFIVMWVEKYKVTSWMLDNVPSLVVNNTDTARTLLSTFIGGLISLTVFSFSMVMVTLNQAAANFTPRLLPGIISNTRHQVVLGFYIGSILYCIVVLLSIVPDGDAYELPGLAIFIAIALGIMCLILFVYFIHSISQQIRVDQILSRIMQRTTERLKYLNKKEERQRKSVSPDSSDWSVINGQRSAYYRGADIEALGNLARDYDTVFHILILSGTYAMEGLPILKSEKQLDKDQCQNVRSCLIFGGAESVDENYTVGFKHITEIAMKAMSPGINDPGTALNAIDYLTHLFAIRMTINDEAHYQDEDGNLLIHEEAMNFSDLLHDTLYSIGLYSKENAKVMQRLIHMINTLQAIPAEKESYYTDLRREEQQMKKLAMQYTDDFVSNAKQLRLP
ncbi:MAG: DUF2254 domain-containing protein [Bacteroidota bacterium]